MIRQSLQESHYYTFIESARINKYHMMFASLFKSFAFKLGATVTLLTMTVASVALYAFYTFSQEALLEEMKDRLKDLTHTGTFLFTHEDREIIEALSDLVLANTYPRTPSFLDMAEGSTKEALPPETSSEYMESAEFQRIVQVLRQVQMGSTKEVTSLSFMKPSFSAPVYWAYLMTPLPESKNFRVMMVLANSNYAKIDHNNDGTFESNEGGQPIGSLYAGDYALFGRPFETGEISISPDWYTDWGGTFMTAVVPIKNSRGKVIATLGLDYLVTRQSERLQQILHVSYAVFFGSVTMALLCSFLLAYVIDRPLTRLRRGAERISKRDFKARIDVRSEDEFGLLADTLNAMAVEIHDYQSGLEKLVEERTKALGSANEEIRSLYETLRKENESLGAELDLARTLQIQALPKLAELNRLSALDIAYSSEPAPQAGGDYFDAILDDRGGMVFGVGDVSGHGLDSGLFMMMMRTAVRTLMTNEGFDLLSAYARVNDVAYQHALQSATPHFMTLSLFVYDGKSTFLGTGQHEDILVLRDETTVEILDTTSLGVPIGIIPDIQHLLQPLTVRLAPRQTMILLSNGVTDMQDARGERFGIEKVSEIARSHFGQTATTTLQAIRNALDDFRGGGSLHDDVTVVVIKQRG